MTLAFELMVAFCGNSTAFVVTIEMSTAVNDTCSIAICYLIIVLLNASFVIYLFVSVIIIIIIIVFVSILLGEYYY